MSATTPSRETKPVRGALMTRQRYLFRRRPHRAGHPHPGCKEIDVPFPDRQLADGEQLVKHLHPHWITLMSPVLTFVITVGLGGYLVARLPARTAPAPPPPPPRRPPPIFLSPS